MPRRSKPARLWLQPPRRAADGRILELAVWCIRDGATKRSTGCREAEREQAEVGLAAYIAERYRPIRDHRPEKVLVSDAISFYVTEIAPSHLSSTTTSYAADRLLDWWAGKSLAEIKTSTCREYATFRMGQSIPSARSIAAKKRKISAGTVARELTVLRAAVRAYHAEHPLDAMPVVTLPETAPGRDRWLSRAEAAALLRSARRHPDRHARKALVRFILIGLYTGSRSGAIRALRWMSNVRGGWVDLDAGVLHRRGATERQTTKRKPPLRIPIRLLTHLRRWRYADGAIVPVIHYAGQPVLRQRRAWDWARREAGLGADVVPHILRHTAATWIMSDGPDLWQAAGFLGMSADVLWRVYGHHHPDFQADLAQRIGRQDRSA